MAVLSVVHGKLAAVDAAFLRDVIFYEGCLQEQVPSVGVVVEEFLETPLRPEVSEPGSVSFLVQILGDLVSTPAAVVC